MGYTHYFKTEGIQEFSEEVLTDVRRITKEYQNIIQREYDEPGEPIIDKDIIIFNGIDDDGHETFVVESNSRGFCKTARKPYDLPVCEVLLVLLHHYKGKFDLSSDGFWVSKEEFRRKGLDGNWGYALKNVEKKFDYKFNLMPEISNSNGHTYYSFNITAA